MAIKKRPGPQPESETPLPDFDHTQAELSIEDLMDQAVRDAKDTGFEKLPTGNWVGVVNSIDTWRSDKGVFYRINLVCNVEENSSFRHTIWCHMLLDDLRTAHEWGPVFYARHLAALGYSKTDNQKAVRDEINRLKPGVIVTSTPNRKNPEWNDVSIRDRLSDDNEEVQLVKENLANQPY